jgi:hypothetical protein
MKILSLLRKNPNDSSGSSKRFHDSYIIENYKEWTNMEKKICIECNEKEATYWDKNFCEECAKEIFKEEEK